jgi:hypothetical protein
MKQMSYMAVEMCQKGATLHCGGGGEEFQNLVRWCWSGWGDEGSLLRESIPCAASTTMDGEPFKKLRLQVIADTDLGLV